jgi:dsRNA-specific ribonuclease
MEAIIGAVGLDSNGDIEAVRRVVNELGLGAPATTG